MQCCGNEALWDVKEPTPFAKSRACSSRYCGLSSVVYHGWEGKCAEILATPSYSKETKVMMMLMMFS